MTARIPLLILAAAAMIGCGEGSPQVTITDLHMKPAPDGVLRTGTFALHVAQPADAPGSGTIMLHSLEVSFGDVGTATVTELTGTPPGDVAPGEEVVRTMEFTLDSASLVSGANPINACTVPSPLFLRGVYFDEAREAFLPIHSEPMWLVSTPLTGSTWAETLGDSGAQLEHDVAVFADGSSVMVGSTSGTLDFEGKKISTSQDTKPFLVKLDPAGKPLWSRYFASSYIDPLGPVQGVDLVATTPGGGVVVAGLLDGTLDLGGGPITSAGDTDVFLTRFDAAGNHLETRRFGDGFSQTVTAMDVDAKGDVILVGALAGAMDFGAGAIAPILDPSFTSYYVARLPEAGAPVYARVPVAVAGASRFVAAIGAEGTAILGGSVAGKAWLGADPILETNVDTGFLVKLAADGSVAWSELTEGAVVLAVAIDEGDVVAALNLGASAILGGQQVQSGASGALALVRFDPAGALRYVVPIGSAGAASVTSLVIDGAGHALLGGQALDPHAIDLLAAGAGALPSAFFTEIDRNGLPLRTQTFGCQTWPIDLAVAHQGPRDVVLAATFSGAVDLGKGTIPGAGQTDLLVARLPAL